MIVRYQSQLQEQQQDPGEPAEPGSADTSAGEGEDSFESTDDIVGDLLEQTGGKRPAAEEEPEAEPEAAAAEEDDDSDDDETSPEPDDAAPADEELTGPLADARKALDAGDIDKAFELAFRKKPEEIQPDNRVWTKWRAANDRAQKALGAERTKLQTDTIQAQNWFAEERAKLNNTIEQLRPYEAHRTAALAWERDGDPSQLVKLVELTAKMPWDEVQKIILTKTRRSPAERQLSEKLAELERKLQETAAAKEQQQNQLTQQQVYAQDIEIIRGQVSKVPEITKVPKYAERIYTVLVKTKGPTGLTLTPEQAAKRVLAAERRRLETHPLLKKPAKDPVVSHAAATLAKARKKPAVTTPLRRDSQNNGARNPKAIETTDDIVADILRQKAGGQ